MEYACAVNYNRTYTIHYGAGKLKKRFFPKTLIQKLRLRHFNKKYTRCEFMDTTVEKRYKKTVFYVKSKEVVKLNTNTNSTYYVVITSDKKAKSMPYNYKNNRNQSVINDLTNPPIGWDAEYISQYMI